MRLRGTRMSIVLAIAAAILPLGGRLARTRRVEAKPPSMIGGMQPPPDDRGYSLDPVDDLSPAFQEGVAEDESQPASPTTTANASSGSVLISDDLTNPVAGILPQSSSHPDRWKVGYTGGAYQVASLASGLDLSETVLIPGTYSDVAVSVNVRVIQGTATAPDQTVRLYCRRQTAGSGFTGYRLQYSSLLNLYAIFRGDGDTGASLTNVQSTQGPPIADATHRLTLTCAGSTITASIDGRKLISVQDSYYHSGRAALGFGNFTRWDPGGIVPPGTDYPGTYDVRFTGLTLTQP